jgi:ankyrin repeat protein
VADAAGGTAMMYAAAKGHAPIVDALSKAGAKWSEAELMMAAGSCGGDVVDWMLKHGANANTAREGRTLLLVSAATGCIDAVRPLVAAGADVNARGPNGRTPLLEAAAAGSVEVVALLLDRGADADAVDSLDHNAAMLATLGRHADVVEFLEKRAKKP